MSKEQLFIFDTTLRDGAQTQGVDFSVDDKLKIALALDNLGKKKKGFIAAQSEREARKHINIDYPSRIFTRWIK